MRELAKMLKDNRPNGELFFGIFGVTDGGRFPFVDYTKIDIQNGYYEAYKCTVDAANLFLYNFKKEIIHAAEKYYSTFHNSKLTSLSWLACHRLDGPMAPSGFVRLGDRAFET